MSFPSSLSSFVANDPRFSLAANTQPLIQRAKREAFLGPEPITLLSQEKLVEVMEKERKRAEEEEKAKKKSTKEAKMFWEGEKNFSVVKMEDLERGRSDIHLVRLRAPSLTAVSPLLLPLQFPSHRS